jgi:hypothetical protein
VCAKVFGFRCLRPRRGGVVEVQKNAADGMAFRGETPLDDLLMLQIISVFHFHPLLEIPNLLTMSSQ